MRAKTEPRYTHMGSALARVAFLLFAPEAGLLFTWFALVIVAGFAVGPIAAGLLTVGGLTFVLVLMCAVAAYMPPTKPFREVSALAARVADLARVASGAALFGAAAAYSGVVGSMMSRMPLDEAMSPAVIWEIVWPIVMVATLFGASVVGIRLGWDFRRSDHRARLLALGRLRAWLPDASMRRHFVIHWLANVVITGSRTGAFMFVGYLAPVIIIGDVCLGIEFARGVS